MLWIAAHHHHGSFDLYPFISEEEPDFDQVIERIEEMDRSYDREAGEMISIRGPWALDFITVAGVRTLRNSKSRSQLCDRCGSIKPAGQSCGCFDNHCE